MTLLRESLLRNVDTRAKLRLQDVAALVESGQLPNALAGEDEDSTVAQLVSGDQVLAQSRSSARTGVWPSSSQW